MIIKGAFSRPCKRCLSKFIPSSKFTFICDNCRKDSINNMKLKLKKRFTIPSKVTQTPYKRSNYPISLNGVEQGRIGFNAHPLPNLPSYSSLHIALLGEGDKSYDSTLNISPSFMLNRITFTTLFLFCRGETETFKYFNILV